MSGDHGAQGAEIADGVFGFELEVGGEDLFGGVVLKADQSELWTAALELVMGTGVGKRHHAETRAGRAPGAILAGPAFLRRGQLGPAQDTAHGLAADGEVLLGVEFLAEMGIVEAPILAAGQAQDQLLLEKGDDPRHGASAIAMLHQGHWLASVHVGLTLMLICPTTMTSPRR